jgi:hypothetical protein
MLLCRPSFGRHRHRLTMEFWQLLVNVRLVSYRIQLIVLTHFIMRLTLLRNKEALVQPWQDIG